MLRKDFVSNSSSCSFILYIQSEEDIKQLSKPDVLKILKKLAGAMDKNFHNVPYGALNRFNDINDVEIGDYIYIYNGEDNEYDWIYDVPDSELNDIADSLNKDYGKLKFYRDHDAHVTLGEDYVEKR